MIHAVIKYNTRSLFFDGERGTEWQHLVFRGNRLEISNISDTYARTAIRENGLVLAEKNSDGEVYDTPDGKFKKAYANRGEEIANRIAVRQGEIAEVAPARLGKLSEIKHSGITEVGRIKDTIKDAVAREAVDIEKILPRNKVNRWADIMADFMTQHPDGTAVTFERLKNADYYRIQCRKASDDKSIVKMIGADGRSSKRLTVFKLPR